MNTEELESTEKSGKEGIDRYLRIGRVKPGCATTIVALQVEAEPGSFDSP